MRIVGRGGVVEAETVSPKKKRKNPKADAVEEDVVESKTLSKNRR